MKKNDVEILQSEITFQYHLLEQFHRNNLISAMQLIKEKNLQVNHSIISLRNFVYSQRIFYCIKRKIMCQIELLYFPPFCLQRCLYVNLNGLEVQIC